MKIFISMLALVFLGICPVNAAIQSEEITYSQGDVTLKGYLAYDDSVEGKRPGILIVHEWWGHNAYARKRAEMLAELGYTAFALDMYGEGKVADHPETASEFSSAIFNDITGVGKARFLAGLDQLKNHPTTDSERVAAIGYCFGGGTVLHMARFGVDLDGVVSFHGSLSSKADPVLPGSIKAKILVCNGADDKMVTPDQIAAFREEMDQAKADYKVINYEGAVHSFTNPAADEFGAKFGIPLAYNESADKQSWQDMQDFFEDIFK